MRDLLIQQGLHKVLDVDTKKSDTMKAEDWADLDAKASSAIRKLQNSMLSVGYKIVIGARSASWHIMSCIEQKEESKVKENNVKLIKGYRHKVEDELSKKIFHDILEIMDKHYLILSSGIGQTTIFYYKM
ncbi:14-3-3-like protein GF14 iota [Nicotiana tomentosiformis]|uniref:14-3-3-like protein GF14 iota n=1 Tax=Nicotiana tomentosiformis TaxID=4098 RepID=UPI00388C5145